MALPHTQYIPGRAEDVTPSNDVDLPKGCIALSCKTTAGVARVSTKDGTGTVDIPLVVGYQHSLRVTRVHATGTTAVGILAYFDPR